MPVKPISPDEVGSEKIRHLPDAVIESFNKLIALEYADGKATVKQKDAVANMVKRGLDERTIFEKGYLNIEEAYKAQGWKVTYDKPGYNETYDAKFIFSKR